MSATFSKRFFFSFQQLMGLWYGSEIITHHETEAYESIYDSCVVVHLADANNEVSRNQSIKIFFFQFPLPSTSSPSSRHENCFNF